MSIYNGLREIKNNKLAITGWNRAHLWAGTIAQRASQQSLIWQQFQTFQMFSLIFILCICWATSSPAYELSWSSRWLSIENGIMIIQSYSPSSLLKYVICNQFGWLSDVFGSDCRSAILLWSWYAWIRNFEQTQWDLRRRINSLIECVNKYHFMHESFGMPTHACEWYGFHCISLCMLNNMTA